MREMLNEMRRQAINTVNNRASTRLGTVAGYDPANYLVRVSIEPDGNLTRWIPLLSPWVGNGWGMFCPPSLGDQVEVEFQEADYDAPISCMRFFTDANRPLNVPSGEFWLVHKTGSLLKFHNDGTIELHSTSDLNATIGGNLNAAVTGTITSSAAQWNHTGAFSVTGAISGSSSITAPNVIGTTNVTFGGKSGIAHTHSGVQTGAGNTGAPN